MTWGEVFVYVGCALSVPLTIWFLAKYPPPDEEGR